MLKNATVGKKIFFGFSLLLLLLAVSGILSIYRLNQISRTVQRLATLEFPETNAFVEAERHMWEAHLWSYQFDLSVDKQIGRQWMEHIGHVEQAIRNIIPISRKLNDTENLSATDIMLDKLDRYKVVAENIFQTSKDGKEILDQLERQADTIRQQLENYMTLRQKALSDTIRENNPEKRTLIAATIQKVSSAIQLLGDIRQNQFHYMMDQKKSHADEQNKFLKDLVTVTNEISTLSAGNDSFNQITQVVANIGKYNDLMEQWVENQGKRHDLEKEENQLAMEIIDISVETTRRSELKSLTAGQNVGKDALRAQWLLAVILFLAIVIGFFLAGFITRDTVTRLKRVIRGLNEAAEQVAAASGQVSSASQSLAEGASEQAASLEETSSSLEQMASMTRQNAAHAKDADRLMKETNQVVNQATDSMGKVTDSMETISKASEDTYKIIKTIDEIAFQTNLLALNAAVEAARAGEAGAGFAVVADEVRNLALRAANAAKDTSGLIESTVKRIKSGSETVEETNRAFSEIAQKTRKVGELLGEISAASGEQAQGVEQINKAVGEMDKVTQQNAANAEESASASEEMSAQANELNNQVLRLLMMVKSEKRDIDPDRKSPKRTVNHNADRSWQKHTQNSKTARKTRPDRMIPLDDDDFSEF